MQQAQALAAKVKDAQAEVTSAEEAFDRVVRSIPNVVLPDVPKGGEDDFVTLRTVGSKP